MSSNDLVKVIAGLSDSDMAAWARVVTLSTEMMKRMGFMKSPLPEVEYIREIGWYFADFDRIDRSAESPEWRCGYEDMMADTPLTSAIRACNVLSALVDKDDVTCDSFDMTEHEFSLLKSICKSTLFDNLYSALRAEALGISAGPVKAGGKLLGVINDAAGGNKKGDFWLECNVNANTISMASDHREVVIPCVSPLVVLDRLLESPSRVLRGFVKMSHIAAISDNYGVYGPKSAKQYRDSVACYKEDGFRMAYEADSVGLMGIKLCGADGEFLQVWVALFEEDLITSQFLFLLPYDYVKAVKESLETGNPVEYKRGLVVN